MGSCIRCGGDTGITRSNECSAPQPLLVVLVLTWAKYLAIRILLQLWFALLILYIDAQCIISLSFVYFKFHFISFTTILGRSRWTHSSSLSFTFHLSHFTFLILYFTTLVILTRYILYIIYTSLFLELIRNIH